MSSRINFFRPQLKGLSYKKMGGLSFGILVLYLLFVGLQYYRAHSEAVSLSRVQAQIENIKSGAGIDESSNGGPVPPAEAVTQAMLLEPSWPEVLRVISKSLSEGIWLEAIHGKTTAEGGLVTIEGTAYQARLVPGFLDRLRAYNAFSKVNLVSSEATGKEVDAPLKFKVEAKTKKTWETL